MNFRTFTFLLMAMFAVSAFAQKPEGVVAKASVAPVIDGVEDAVWDSAYTHDITGEFIDDFAAPTLGLPGETTWKALWDDAGVYVLLTVTDDWFYPYWAASPDSINWVFDMTELYFDCNSDYLEDGNGSTAGSDGYLGHYQFMATPEEGELNGELQEQDGSYSSAFTVDDPTYKVEYMIPWEKLIDQDNKAVDRTREIGFDVTIIDRDPGDIGRKRAVWANVGEVDQAWGNMDDCGIIFFEGAEEAKLIESISLSAGDITENNGTVQIEVTILPEDATTKTLKWSIVDAEEGRAPMATISPDGLVTGRLNGEVTIKAEATDESWQEETVVVNIENQIVTSREVSLIKNGYFDEVNSSGEALDWDGNHFVSEGFAIIDPPDQAANVWNFQFAQQEPFGCNVTDEYRFRFVAWAAESDTFNVNFEDDEAHSWARTGTSKHEYSYGESDWTFQTETEPTWYDFDVIFENLEYNSTERVAFRLGHHGPEVYLDSVELINSKDLEFLYIDYVPAEFIDISAEGGATHVAYGGTLQMSAVVIPEDATVQDVDWSVVPETGEATIDAGGVLTGVASGDVMVYATGKEDKHVFNTYEVTVSNPEGIDQQRVNTLKLYPNPAVSELNVVLTRENSTVTIYNSLGMKMEEVIVTGTEHRFNISDYASGLYFVKTGTQVAKFVK